MASYGWGECSRCGTPLGSILKRGTCDSCMAKDRKKQATNILAKPEKLVEHPDLAEVDATLNGWYG